jgi:hypothetical protein
VTTSSPNSRPWYRIRWPIAVIAVAAIIGSTYLHYQSNKPIKISVTSGPTGHDKTLKQRMIFMVNLEKNFHKRGWPASFDLTGDDGKIITLYWEQLTRPMVQQIIKSQDIIASVREMGFKKLVMRSAKQTWDIDLKN